jgi:hypothetical protein
VPGEVVVGEEEVVEVGDGFISSGASKEDRRIRSARRFFWFEKPKTTSTVPRALGSAPNSARFRGVMLDGPEEGMLVRIICLVGVTGRDILVVDRQK